jgi:hypothetical protein
MLQARLYIRSVTSRIRFYYSVDRYGRLEGDKNDVVILGIFGIVFKTGLSVQYWYRYLPDLSDPYFPTENFSNVPSSGYFMTY